MRNKLAVLLNYERQYDIYIEVIYKYMVEVIFLSLETTLALDTIILLASLYWVSIIKCHTYIDRSSAL